MTKKTGASKSSTATSFEIAKNLFLVEQRVSDPGCCRRRVATPTNHIAVLDVSGSMSGDLPQLRDQLKRKLTKLLRDGDTLSMIWFSGRGQFGTLFEAEPVASLADLKSIHDAIDRWLRPIGMTGFKEPLEEVASLIKRVQGSTVKAKTFSLFFMSDGCDNQWNRADVLKTCERVAGDLASATFVEYGYYADRPLLSAMAEKCGGTLIHADRFDKYEPVFEAALAKSAPGRLRSEVKISGDPIGGFAYALYDDEIFTYEAGSGKVRVPTNITSVWYLSSKVIGTLGESISEMAANVARVRKHGEATLRLSPAYAALSLFAVRMKPEIVWPILSALGDVAFIEQFSSCFGKQKYSEFVEYTKLAAFGPGARYVRGFDPNAVPKDDAFTVLDVLRILEADESTRLLLDDPTFKYSRISRKREDADDLMSEEETEKINALNVRMMQEKNATKLRELQAQLNEIMAAKKEPLKFVGDPAPDGYPINGLVYNETRPNISLRVLKNGTVDLTGRMPKGKVPQIFKTKIWRNYTLIRDGLVNIAELPVIVSPATCTELQKNMGSSAWMIVGKGNQISMILDVSRLPILNRKMVKNVTATELVANEWKLVQAKARQKVFKHYVDEKFGDAIKLKSFAELYGEDGAAWLKDQGLTPNGFAPPHTKQAEATDVYMGRELEVKLAGYASLPSVNDVLKRVSNPKSKPLSGGAKLVGATILEIDTFLRNAPASTHEKWLVGHRDVAIATARALMHRSAELKFGVLVGNVWFPEFKSMDENVLTLTLDGETIEATIEAREIEIAI